MVRSVVRGEQRLFVPISPPVTPSGLTSFKGLVGSPLNTTKLARLLLTPGGGVVSTTLTVMLAPALLEAANTGLVMPELGGIVTSRSCTTGDGGMSDGTFVPAT